MPSKSADPSAIRHGVFAPSGTLRTLLAPVDNSQLVLFRIALGALIAIECFGAIFTGWVHQVFVAPQFTFTFIGFEGLHVLLGPPMYAWFALMGIAGILVMVGLWYRAAIVAFAVMWAVCHVMQKSSYNNHYYLLLLVAGLMAVSPAHRWASVDCRRRPELRSPSCPHWCVLVFIAQTALVYFYAAVAKLDADWLEGRPLAIWLGQKRDYPVVGALYEIEWLPVALAWGGLMFDALIVPALLWRRTRWWAFGAAIFFHLFNSITFGIGIFPFFALSLCVFFFPRASVRARFFPGKPNGDAGSQQVVVRTRDRVLLWGLAVYFALQVALPLRHHLYDGDVTWTEEGHRFSWRMMLRTKSGTVSYLVRDAAAGREWDVSPQSFVELGVLTQKQVWRMPGRPEHVWQFGQYLADHYAAIAGGPVEVYARTEVSLNGRPAQAIVDPSVNLAATRWRVTAHNPWITSRPPPE